MDEGKTLLFADIKFIIAQCNSAEHIKTLLIEGGAKLINYLSEHVTLVIADNNCPEAEEAVELFDKPVVSSLWVHLSIKANTLLPTEAFSPTRTILFNHVIASISSDLSKNDVDILASTLTFYGARVSKDIANSTHFIVAKADCSDLPKKSDLNCQFKIVTPDWVQESVRLNRCCNEQFFDPTLLLPPPPPTPSPPPPQLPAPLQVREKADCFGFSSKQSVPKDLPSTGSKYTIVTPDWVQKSVRLNRCCNEQFFDSTLLLPPPPPTNSPPPPQPRAKVQVKEDTEYFGYAAKQSLPKDLPLYGCKFKLDQYENIDSKQKEKWCNSIKAAGGLVVEDLKEATILICEDRLSPLFSEALNLGIRCVTIYWINDVLGRDLLTFPWRALHLPVPFSKKNKPLTDHIITTTNLNSKDRRFVREMLVIAGAKYTDYFSQSNTLLICGNVGGEKYDRSLTLRIPIANCRLLSDILMQSSVNLGFMLAQAKYQLFNLSDPLKLTSYAEVRSVMKPWRVAITIAEKSDSMLKTQVNGNSAQNSSDHSSNSEGTIKKDPNATGNLIEADCSIKNQQTTIGNDENIKQSDESVSIALESRSTETKSDPADGSDCRGSAKISDSTTQKICNESASSLLIDPSALASKTPAINQNNLNSVNRETEVATSKVNDKNEESYRSTRSIRKSNSPTRILFTHLERQLTERLISYAEKLDLGFATVPTNCTHLIVDRISRTTKFICAMNHADYILSYKWITESHEANKILDEKHFFLDDKSGEEEFSVNLVHSLYKRKKRAGALFNNYVFFVTPSIRPKGLNLKEMIESAGGVMTTKKLPSSAQIQQMMSDGKRFVIVACSEDSHLCSAIDQSVVDIVDIEFVISGILRQDVDFPSHLLKMTPEGFVRSAQPYSSAVSTQPSPNKKIRQEVSS